MLIFNHSRECNRVKGKRALFKVMSSIKIIRTPKSGIGCTSTLTGYSIELMQFT